VAERDDGDPGDVADDDDTNADAADAARGQPVPAEPERDARQHIILWDGD
jgi:hypothetical protein